MVCAPLTKTGLMPISASSFAVAASLRHSLLFGRRNLATERIIERQFEGSGELLTRCEYPLDDGVGRGRSECFVSVLNSEASDKAGRIDIKLKVDLCVGQREFSKKHRWINGVHIRLEFPFLEVDQLRHG